LWRIKNASLVLCNVTFVLRTVPCPVPGQNRSFFVVGFRVARCIYFTIIFHGGIYAEIGKLSTQFIIQVRLAWLPRPERKEISISKFLSTAPAVVGPVNFERNNGSIESMAFIRSKDSGNEFGLRKL